MGTSRSDDAGEQTTLLHDRFDPSPEAGVAFRLTVLEGPDTGATMLLDDSTPRILVGQTEACDFRLRDREVSRRHAALELRADRLRITDLDSKNGTYVDRVCVREAYLTGGETVRMGSTQCRVEREAATAEAPLSPMLSFGRMIGVSREMRRLYPLCERLAQSGIPLVIEGETGTGKEVLAEALHEQGPRAAGPFVVFDCTAVPPNLVESELFGHERGAFTGAVARRRGVLEQAHGGTLLIDEIGDLDLALQPKLLRAIERSEFRRVGGDGWVHVDVRVICATRRDLDREVQAGRFRDDLFHRLAVARIELPPLRDRRGDVSVLARRFCKDLGGSDRDLSSAQLVRWEEWSWPGNVRELRNAVARQLALGDLGAKPGPAAGSSVASVPAHDDSDSAAGAEIFGRVLDERLPLIVARQHVVEVFERHYIARVLSEHGGNVVRAAAASGVARRYFQILRAKRDK